MEKPPPIFRREQGEIDRMVEEFRQRTEAHLAEGVKHDDDKVRIDLVDPQMIFGIAHVLGFGAKKYEENNWAKGINYNRLYRALIGHMHAWWMGEDLDEESGLPHLWHAGCCLMFLIHYECYRTDYNTFDNRPDLWDHA